MKRSILLAGLTSLAVALTTAMALADFGELPEESVQQFAPQLIEGANKEFDNAPVRPELNAEKAVGLQSDDGGGMILAPENGLSAEKIKSAGEKPVSLGVLFSLQVALVGKDGPLTNEQLTLVPLDDNEVQAALLTVRAGEDGARILEVYGKGEKPLLSVPLKAIKGDGGGVTLKTSNFDGNVGTADLALTIDGKYRADLKIAVTMG